jgi:hypothetical protein
MRKPINSMLIYSNVTTETKSSFFCKAFKVTELGDQVNSSYNLTSDVCKNALILKPFCTAILYTYNIY